MEKRRAIFDKHRFNADILILQETHSTAEREKLWRNEWGGEAIFSHGTNMARGVAVLTSKEIFQNINNIYLDASGRCIILDLNLNRHAITIAAIYAPNEDNPKFFENIEQVIKNRHEHKIIIGDFNLTLDVNLDRENTYCNNNRAKEKVEEIMDHYSLRDVWRIHNGERREFSWIKKGSFPVKASRIDMALVSGGLDQMIKNTSYISSIMTDHRAFYMVIEPQSASRGTGFWKMNTTLLRNREYIEIIKREINRTLQASQQKDPGQLWEILKKRIKETTVEFSKNKVAEDKLVISELSEIINDYESRLPLNQDEDKLLENTKADLEEKNP